MKCPHCLTEFHDQITVLSIGDDVDGYWKINVQTCPACERFIIALSGTKTLFPSSGGISVAPAIIPVADYLVRPKTANRPPPPEVPEEIACDFIEACLVIADSPKASAALSRRCLQHILREKAGVSTGTLSSEIQQVIDSGHVPTHISEAIDAVRNVGNFAAHPIKSDSTGEIVDVEPGEAEWNLDVIESLFDFYFVQPQIMAKRRAALNAKLKDAGKPEMKSSNDD